MKRFRKNDIIARDKRPEPGDSFLVVRTDGFIAEIERYRQEGYSARVTVMDPENWHLIGRNTLVGHTCTLLFFWKWDWSWLI